MKELFKNEKVSIGFLWTSSSSGESFSRNSRSSAVMVYVCGKSEAPATCKHQFEAGKARTKSDAESVARKFIKENEIRKEFS